MHPNVHDPICVCIYSEPSNKRTNVPLFEYKFIPLLQRVYYIRHRWHGVEATKKEGYRRNKKKEHQMG
jgi:hypothetical protein